LMLSQIVTVSTEGGYMVHEYDVSKGVVEFRHETCLSEPPLIFLIDDPQVAVNIVKIRLAFLRARSINPKTTVVVAMISDERMEELHGLDPRAEIYDVSQRLAGE